MEKRIKLGSALACLMGVFFLYGIAHGETMFPKDTTVYQKCAACHTPDPQGRLEVIEETRKSPEEWKNVADRMIRVNGAPLEDADFNAVIKELSRDLCLTPDEMADISYINSDENSQYREVPQNELEQGMYLVCVRCHTWGKLASHRNTKSQWEEIRNLHIGYYPTVILQMRQMDWAKESKDLIEPLAQRFAFDAPKWREWIKSRKDQSFEGAWVVAGYQPGMGYYQGSYMFFPNPAKGKDEYIIEREIRYENGAHLKMGGEGTVYAGYHLRYAFAPTPLTGRIEGVFDFNDKAKSFSGKWWTVVQDTNAFGNEAFVRADASPKIISVFPQALIASDDGQRVTIVGVNLPEALLPEDIRFSDQGIAASSIDSIRPSEIVCMVKVAKDAKTGLSMLRVKGLAYENPLKIYHQVDGIKILPALGRARVSCGAAYPPQGVQFVARAISYGADGKAGTPDDLVLEPVDAKWRLEEQKTNDADDDLKYLRTSIVNGLYTPVTTYGPIEERLMRKEGTGLIAVCASIEDNGRELKDRARLAVTVPDFITHIK
jgi:quinohemoprotein amine dehydrogenase